MKKLFYSFPYSLKFIASIVLFFSTMALYSQVAPVNPPSNGFYINGKVKADSADVGDWVDGIGTGGFVLQATGAPPVWGPLNAATTKIIRDPYDNSTDKIFSGSSFGDNPNTWKWTAGKATAKCDINNALFHSTTSATQKWLILGGDRFATTGTSYIDFQFSQGIFKRNDDSTFTSLSADSTSLAATGGRTVGDFVLSMEYTNGGALATVHYYRWEDVPLNSGSNYKFVEKPIPAPGGVISAYGKSNTVAIDVPYGAFGAISYIPFSFVEAAVNIDAILTGSCQSVNIKTIFVSTKASDSYSAALKDFVDPQRVNFVFGQAGLSYGNTPFCKSGTVAPTVPTASDINGSFVGSPGLVINGSTGVVNLTSTDAGTYTATYTPTGGVCLTPSVATITINPIPSVSVPSNQNLCNGTSTSAVNFSGTPTGVTFAWTNNNTSIGLGASGSGNINAFTATNSGTSSAIATITVTPSANGCTGSSQSFTITVKPTPTVVDPSDQVLCNGASTTAVTFSGAVSGTTFNWTNNNTSIGLAASGSTNINAFTATNSGATSAVATITVTPTANGCAGSSQSFTITVKPTPTVTDPPDQSLCAGFSTNAVNFSGAVAGTTFNWVNNTTSIGLAASGSTNISSFTAVNAGSSNVTATITVTPSASGCSGSSQSFTITVNANPAQPAVNITQPTCSVNTATVTVTSPLDAGSIDYEYSNNSGTYTDNVSFTVAPGGSYSIRARIKGTGCVSTAITGSVQTTSSTPAATAIITQNVDCSHSTGKVKIVQASTGNPEYDPAIFEFSNGGVFGSNPEFTFTAGGGYSLTVRRKSDHTCTATASCAAEGAGAANNTNNITDLSARSLGSATLESSVIVKAQPNPFSDQVRFMITNPEAGSGTLDIYNLSGQKIKTVYQGNIPAGVSYFDLKLLTRERGGLVYVLKIGDQKVSGNLLHLSNK